MFRRWVLPALLAAGLAGSALTASAAPAPDPRLDAPQTIRPADRTATVKVITHPTAGTILADGDNHALYLFTRDERNKSNCSPGCLAVWPPLVTEGTPMAGAGVTQSRLGTITLPDGRKQVTYNGWPLYYYVQDKELGDVKGQNVNNVWFVVSPYGGPRINSFEVKVTDGRLTDASGRTLYLYTRDVPGWSNCMGTCAENWPPALSVGPGKAGAGAHGNLLDVTRREEGSTQLTYNGWPLYYFAGDDKPGDTKGQGVGGVWWAMSATGQGITSQPGMAAPATTAPATPAALPRTGEAVSGLLAFAGIAGAAAAAAGAWLRRRTAA